LWLWILTHDVGIEQAPTVLRRSHVGLKVLDILLEALESSTILSPLLHQISCLPDELGVLFGELLLR
jgi:hypothetical protein